MQDRVCRIRGRLLKCLVVLALLPGPIFSHTSAEEASERIDRLLAGRYAADAPGAAVLVARKGTVILRKGYGLADLEHGIAVSPQAVFGTGCTQYRIAGEFEQHFCYDQSCCPQPYLANLSFVEVNTCDLAGVQYCC